MSLLLKINKELGLTIFLITHELNVVQRICDRIAVMENGYVVEQGTVVSLFTNPKHPTTKRFVESENTFTIPSEIMASYRSTGKLVSLHFVGNELSEEPALALVSRKFNVLPSILAGGIEQLKNHTLGKLLVHLRGEKEEYEQAITYLTNQGVIVEEVN